MSSIMRWRSGVIESSIAGWERLRAALPCWLKRSLSGAQELSHRLPEARASCFAPSRDTARYAQRLVQPALSNPADHGYRGLDCTAFAAWTHFARNATGAITHPLKGNSVFSERESLLKCTERFGPLTQRTASNPARSCGWV